MGITDKVGKAIAYYREKKDWSTVQLAEVSGLSQASISLYENGKRNPSEEAIVKIANALQISVDDIIHKAESFELESDANESKSFYSNIREELVRDSNYDIMRRFDRIKRNSDLLFELSPDILLSLNMRMHDMNEYMDYKLPKRPVPFGREYYSALEHLIEKVFYDFLQEHKVELSFRIEEEMKHLHISAQQLIEDLRYRK